MKMKARITITSILAAMGLVGLFDCAGGTGEGNPEFGVLSVSLGAKAGLPVFKASAGLESPTSARQAATDTLLLLDAAHTPYRIHHIFAHLDQVEIVRPKGGYCRGTDSVVCTDTTLVVSGSRFIDLLESPDPVILRDFTLPLGVYNRMKVRLSKLTEGGSESIPTEYLPLVGHSILMKGTFAYNGVPNRGLTIYLDVDDVIAFENSTGLAVTTDSPYKWAGVFLAGAWLKELEITKCLDENHIALEPDGSLVIDSGTTCNDLRETLAENVRSSTLFEMDDEDDVED